MRPDRLDPRVENLRRARRMLRAQSIEEHLKAAEEEETAYMARTGYHDGADPYDVNWDAVFQLDHRLRRPHTCTVLCRRIAAARTAPDEEEK